MHLHTFAFLTKFSVQVSGHASPFIAVGTLAKHNLQVYQLETREQQRRRPAAGCEFDFRNTRLSIVYSTVQCRSTQNRGSTTTEIRSARPGKITRPTGENRFTATANVNVSSRTPRACHTQLMTSSSLTRCHQTRIGKNECAVVRGKRGITMVRGKSQQMDSVRQPTHRTSVVDLLTCNECSFATL